ncbi:response regulator receiver protein (plasmid) [Caballeronia cordobensis]|nr:response regulator receiver protein [Burkholderia sp. RPE67]
MTPGVSSDAERTRVRRRIVADLWRAVWAWRYQTAAAIVLMISARLAVVSVPLMLKRVIDEFSHPATTVVFPVFLVLAYVLLRYLGDVLNEARDVVFSIVTQRTVASFAERTFAHLHALGARFHAQRETGAVVRDVQKGADGVGCLLGTAFFTIVPVMIEISTVVAVMMSSYAIEFMVIITVTFVLYSVWTLISTRYRMRFQRAVNSLRPSPIVVSSIACSTMKPSSSSRASASKRTGSRAC